MRIWQRVEADFAFFYTRKNCQIKSVMFGFRYFKIFKFKWHFHNYCHTDSIQLFMWNIGKNAKLSWLKDEWSFKEFQSRILNTSVPLLNFKQNSQVRIEAYQFYASKPLFSLSFSVRRKLICFCLFFKVFFFNLAHRKI